MIPASWCVRAEAREGGVRVLARDWPLAPWFSAACALPGVPLLAWSVAEGHAIEGGGAAVFVGLAAFGAWLAASRRREVTIDVGDDRVRVSGTEGWGPFARTLDRSLAVGAEVVVEPFPVPSGAPDLPDRGGDLALVAGDDRLRLARAAGPGWRDRLAPAEGVLRAALRRS